MKETKEIEAKYGVTRQTLNNWVKANLITSPCKDKNGKLIWTEKIEKEIKILIKNKNENKNTSQNTQYFLIGNRRYLGSKQKALNFIDEVVSKNTHNVKSVADIFGGTGVVANHFSELGMKIIVNDILYSNFTSYQTWFSNDKVDFEKIEKMISSLNKSKGVRGYVTENFGGKYFSLENAMKIDSIREKIEKQKNLNSREYAILLTSLLYAMDKVANTVGHYDAYRKHMDANVDIYLKIPQISKNNANEIYNEDANDLVRHISADLVYIDTPYNSRGYESAYHVLENIMEWKKPEVEGVARKAIDKKNKSSIYNRVKAPEAFNDLVENIDAKYILVSYNNMGNKGNSRSNAKISHEEIINSLEKRGEVKVFEMDFAPFSSGKSIISNHKELLYLCTVKNSKYINTPLNYTGSKFKLLNQILPLMDVEMRRFFDIFSGGASVAINHLLIDKRKSNLRKYVINDIDKNVIGLYKFLSITDYQLFLNELERLIVKFGLSDTVKYGYSIYINDSTDSLANFNKGKYLELRTYFNSGGYDTDLSKYASFYLLIVFGFNNQIRYNSKGEYNLPVGKRDFNSQMRDKLERFVNVLKENKFVFTSKDFRKFSEINSDDFVYADPPYILGNASYNENGNWTERDDDDLLNFLDYVHDKGAKFALSNVVLHKGVENTKLMNWASKYHLNVLNYNYNNSNYHSKAKNTSTVEVLITNYRK